MRFGTVLISLLLSTWQLRAQVNLIANGSFEIIDTTLAWCPNSAGQIWIANGWSTVIGSVDYYNTCSNSAYPEYGTPNNRLGVQLPRTGDGYASLLCYINPWPNQREYLWTQLNSSLIANQKYYLEYYVNLSDSSNFAISNFGAHISVNDTRYLSPGEFLNLESSIHFDTTSAINDTNGWTRISGTFTAAGGEQYLTISAFGLDTDDPYIERLANNNPDRWDGAMYLIDDVSLTRVGDVGIEEPSASLGAYPNPCTDVLQLELPAVRSPLQITVVDVVGRSIEMLRSVQGNRYAIDVSAWPSGVYLLRGADETGRRFSTRVLKQ
ncbi:MAG: T9SS type A sorting domain-containing protein [Flavobacteriales bacterium]|nr:T9SS type A sorting domain-containing protein [Flavobacteriales bacterium]